MTRLLGTIWVLVLLAFLLLIWLMCKVQSQDLPPPPSLTPSPELLACQERDALRTQALEARKTESRELRLALQAEKQTSKNLTKVISATENALEEEQDRSTKLVYSTTLTGALLVVLVLVLVL